MFKPQPTNRRLRINNQIRASELTIIDDEGTNLGVMSTGDALKLAIEKELDLVEVAPDMKPPIAKIIDYGKYIYQKEKRAKDAKPTKAQEIKIVQIGFKTGQHDLEIRAGQADKFLEKGYRVKFDLRLRGREKGMSELGRKKLSEFLNLITFPYIADGQIRSAPSGLSITIKPETKIKHE